MSDYCIKSHAIASSVVILLNGSARLTELVLGQAQVDLSVFVSPCVRVASVVETFSGSVPSDDNFPSDSLEV